MFQFMEQSYLWNVNTFVYTGDAYAALTKLVPEIRVDAFDDKEILLSMYGIVWQGQRVSRPWTVRDVAGVATLDAPKFYALPSASALTRQRLRERGVSYVTDAGQAFFLFKGMRIVVEFPDGGKARTTGATLTSFSAASLRLAFTLLRRDDLLKRDLRTMAQAAGIGLGSAKRGIDYLVQQGYLSKGAPYRWLDRASLIDAWVEGYALRLRNKVERGFVMVKDFVPSELPAGLQLGGADASQHYGGRLLAGGQHVLYTSASIHEAMRTLRAVPAERWNVELREAFWPLDDAPVVPPLVVYAELLLSGGRGVEEAARIKPAI